MAALEQESVEALLARLSETSWVQRRAVVTALAHAGDAALSGFKEILLSRRDDETRLASTVEALVASSGNVDAALLPLLEEDTPAPALCDVIVVLGRRRSKRAVTAIEKLVAHADANVAIAAIEALGRLGNGAGTSALIGVVGQRDFFRTFPAIEVLGKTRDSRAAAVLIELLKDPLYASAAARALGDVNDPHAIDALLGALLSDDEPVASAGALALASFARFDRTRLRERLGQLGDLAQRAKATAAVQRVWSSVDGEEKISLVHLLSAIGGASASDALLDIARNERDVSVAIADGLRGLGRHIDAPLLEIIRDGTSRQRLVLLPVLGSAPGGIEPLLRCLNDDEAEVRAAAASTLARIGQIEAVGALFSKLEDASQQVVQAAIAAIQSLGSARTEALALQAAKHPDISVRRSAFRIISYFGYRSGADLLIAAALSIDERERNVAVPGLPYLDDPRARQTLIAATRNQAPRTRAVATRALADLGVDAELEGALAQAIADDDAWVRYYACMSIGRLGAIALVPEVIARLDDSAGQVRVAAIEALGHLRDERAKRTLEQATQSPDMDVRRAAIIALGSFGDKDTLQVLLGHTASPDSSVRLMTLSSLSKYDDPQATRALRHAAFDGDPTVHQSAISLLGARRDPAATQALIDLVDQRHISELVLGALASDERHLPHIAAALDTSGAERSAALVQILLRFRRPSAESALIDALRTPNVHARRAVASAIDAMSSAEARAALTRAAHDDEDAEVRERAAASLSGL